MKTRGQGKTGKRKATGMINKGTVKKEEGKVRLKSISESSYCGKGWKEKLEPGD